MRDPARTIPRAIPVALAITAAVYAAVGLATSHALGVDGLAHSTAPLADAVTAAGAEPLLPVVRAGAALAATGSLLGLVLGVSRTTFAMTRDGCLPRALGRVHAAYRVPHRAEVTVGAGLAVAMLAGDLRGAIGLSPMCVLTYHTIANASAWTLQPSLRHRVVPALGMLGCVSVALALPVTSVVSGALVLAVGAALWLLRFRAAPELRP